MRVLLVAPTSKDAALPQVDNEIEAVVNSGGSLSVRLMHGAVTQRDIINVMRAEQFDIMWFATHGNQDGILLTGEILSPSAIVAMVRGTQLRLVFLNTCSSIAMATALMSEANVDVICTFTDVPDIDAYRTGSLFASYIAKGKTLREAYEASKPGRNSTYVYLTGATTVKQNGLSDFGKLHAKVDELENASRERDKEKVAAKSEECKKIIKTIEDHSGVLTEHDNRIMALEYHVFPSSRVRFWRLLSLVFIAVAFVIFLWKDTRDAFFAVWYIGGLLELMLFAFSGLLYYIGMQTKDRELDRERKQ